MRTQITPRKLAGGLTIGICILAVMSVLTVSGRSDQDHEDASVQIKHSADELTALGLKAYLLKAQANHTPTPRINSRWAELRSLRGSSSQVDTNAMQSASDFGLAMAKLMTEQANHARATTNTNELVDICTNMLETAAWIAGQPGYGNMLLASRAYDVASLCVVKLAADDAFPLEKTQALTDKFDWSWGSLENRRRILHEATLGKYYEPRPTPYSEEDFAVIWAQCFSLFRKHEGQAMPPELEIFGAQEISSGESQFMPETTWNKRVYSIFGLVGFGSVNYRNAKMLCNYRRHFGPFPAELANSNASIEEFDKVFEKVIWRKPIGFGGVFAVYYAYKHNMLVDVGYSSVSNSH
ncbi:MAG: hypothetical protein U1F77_01260 [Kiritimatiellia bacterium]